MVHLKLGQNSRNGDSVLKRVSYRWGLNYLPVRYRYNSDRWLLSIYTFFNVLSKNKYAWYEKTFVHKEIHHKWYFCWQFDGRMLPQEDIVFRDNRKVPAGPNADWSNAFRNESMISAVPLQNWVVLYTRRDQGRAQDFISLMLKICPGIGMLCNPPTRFELRDDRLDTYTKAVKDHINPAVSIHLIYYILGNNTRVICKVRGLSS